MAAKDRVEGEVSRDPGHRNISVAISTYLKAKEKISEEALSRQQLLDYFRRGKRWSCLAGPSPILVFLFPRAADTIVNVLPRLSLYYCLKTELLKRQNNSITESTIQSLPAHVWHDNPELVRVLVEVSQYAGLALAYITQGTARIEDVVARTEHAFGPLLCIIP
jgi:hypothetical protein